MTRALSPMINSMNVLMLHTTNAREVARSMEGGNNGGVDGNFFDKRGGGQVYCADWTQGAVDHV